MSKQAPTKSKPRPWIPPGKGTHQNKKRDIRPETIVKSKKGGDHVRLEVSPQKVSFQSETVDVPEKEASKDKDADMLSLSSHSSYELSRLDQENELDIHHVALLQEMKLLYVHFASLKTSYLSAYRIIDYEAIEDGVVNELFIEAGYFMKALNSLFDDLEYSVSVLENTLNENEKKMEFSTVLRNKEKLLSNLLSLYEKVILIFQVVFEEQDFKELQKVQASLAERLKIAERKNSSQEAVITDLERRLSVSQSKAANMESYKAALESAKADLERSLLHKESQIKYLKDELMNASKKGVKPDREDFIQVFEVMNIKAEKEKSDLKEALKVLRVEFAKVKKTNKKLLREENKKDNMIEDLAAQRDQLKVQLTVINNNLIQLKFQIEEMKSQSLKLQSEMVEEDLSHKKEVAQLKSTIEEKSIELEACIKQKEKLEETVIELEDELKKSKEHFKAPKDADNIPKQTNLHTSTIDMHEEIPRLVALLQNTRETFESLIHSGYHMSASGDHISEGTEFGNHQKEIFAIVSEIKNYILELKNQLLPFLHTQKDVTEPKSLLKRNDFEKQFEEMKLLYESAAKENQSLKQKLEDLRNMNVASSTAQKAENYFSTDAPSKNLASNLQIDVYKKDEEIARLKVQLAQQEKHSENQLREYKDKLRNLEADKAKTDNLAQELESTKLELRVLQNKKEEETESILKRNRELQESLDKKIEECKNLEQYIQLIKVSYFRVFGNS